MNEINYEKARDMREVIEKYNSYAKGKDEFLSKRSIIKSEYLYHVTQTDESDDIMNNLPSIKKYGLILQDMYDLSEVISSKYNGRKTKRVSKMLDLLDKLEVLYCSPTTKCSIFGIGLAEDNEHTMFRFKTSLAKGFLYKDPETEDCFATICLVNIPAKYLQIGTPVKTIKPKGYLDYTYGLDFEYKWKDLI